MSNSIHIPAFSTGGKTKSLGMGGHTLPNEGATKIWLTPPTLLEKLGPFDLDPCAAPSPRPWPTAARHIELPEDGLTASWMGQWCTGCGTWASTGGIALSGCCARCDTRTEQRPLRSFCNPPYTQGIDRWIDRMNKHARGISLIFARTETSFWQEVVWPHAHAILFLNGRLFFHTPDGERGSSNAGAPSVLIAHSEEDADILKNSKIEGYLVRESFRIR